MQPLADEALRRPDGDWRSVPSTVRAAIRFVRAAAPGHLERVWALQALSGVAAALGVALAAVLVRELVALDSDESALATLLPVIAAMTVLGLIGNLAAGYHTVNQELVAEQVGAAAVDRILDASSAVELEAFDDPAYLSRLHIAQTQAGMRPWQVVESVSSLSRVLFTTIGVLVALIVLSPLTVGLLVVVVVPIAVVVSRRSQIEFQFVRNASTPERLRASYIARLNSKDGAADVRAHAMSGLIRGRITALQREIIALKRAARRRQAWLMFLSNVGGIVVLAATLAVLAWLFDRDRLSVPTAGAMAFGLARVVGMIGFAGYAVGLLHESSLFLRDIDRFLAESRTRSTGDERVIPSASRAPVITLRADDVSYRYPGAEHDALCGVSVELCAGRVVALVGENGSGKTTLAKIFGGLFRPTVGALWWDRGDGQVKVADDDLADLRGSVAMVVQNANATAWPTSAHDHVAFGDVSRIDDRGAVTAAAELAGAQFAGELTFGWDTTLSSAYPGGVDLSGGQWQRLALARAFFRDAPLIILDEPTASLDARAEDAVFQRVRALARGRAVLLISHRFSTVRLADEIVVLERGRIAEQGSHAALMSLGGHYAEMYTLQIEALQRPPADQ